MKVLGPLLVLLVLGMTSACDSASPEVDAPPAKVNVNHAKGPSANGGIAKMSAVTRAICHRIDKTRYARLDVSGAAYPKHLAHGDAPVWGNVPEREGYYFDEQCQPVMELDIPGDRSTVPVFLGPFFGVESYEHLSPMERGLFDQTFLLLERPQDFPTDRRFGDLAFGDSGIEAGIGCAYHDTGAEKQFGCWVGDTVCFVSLSDDGDVDAACTKCPEGSCGDSDD